MDDLIKSLKAHLYDRATSPLTGAFILSWFLWNWEIVLLAISDSYIFDKLFHLKKIGEESGYEKLLVYPLSSTVFIIVIYPLFSNLAYGVSKWHQTILHRIRAYFDDKTPMTKEEAAALRREIYQTKDNYEKEIEKLQLKIRELEEKDPEILAKKMQQLSGSNSTNLIENKYPEETYQILKLVRSNRRQRKTKIFDKIIKELEINELNATVILKELIDRRYVEEEQDLLDMAKSTDPMEKFVTLNITGEGESLLLRLEEEVNKPPKPKSKGFY